MNGTGDVRLAKLLREVWIERQRLLIREANYLRKLVGLPPVESVKAEGERKGEGGRNWRRRWRGR